MEEFRTFDFHRIFFGDLPYGFLLEIIFRTTVMYSYTIILLRLLGKRSMGQLSTLELAIIICFGSAVGDPMMGKDIPIIHGMVVITTVALLQTAAEWVINRNKRLETFMEGRADCLVENGLIVNSSLNRNNLSHEDLFRFLRSKDIEQLGQVKNAFFETSGLVSVWCYPKPEVVPGLGIHPGEEETEPAVYGLNDTVPQSSYYSCTHCGFTIYMRSRMSFTKCPNCAGKEWAASVSPENDQRELVAKN